MDFKARNAKIGSARGEHKVSNLSPETWILRREKGKSGPRKGSIKCLFFTLNTDFNLQNAKIGSARREHKVSNF